MWRRSCQRKSYDGNGNATARQGNSIVWSITTHDREAGSGSTAETVAFAYGPDRKRWQQMYTGNGTSETTNYVGGLMEVVSSGSTTTYRHYIYAGRRAGRRVRALERGHHVQVHAIRSSGEYVRFHLQQRQ